VGGRDLPEQRGRHDAGHQQWRRLRRRLRQHEICEQNPELVAGQQQKLAGSTRHRGRESVGVRVVRQHQIRARAGRQRKHEVERAGLFGVGLGRGGKASIGLGLLGDHFELEAAALLQRASPERQADAVQRRVGDAQRTRSTTSRRQTGLEFVEVRSFELRTERDERSAGVRERPARDLTRSGQRRAAAFDLGVGG
jgi:hypothetical protein